MTRQELLQNQFALFYRTVKANLADVTAEDALTQPVPGGNCTNWIVGHVTHVQNAVATLVGADPVWASAQLERDWNEPITSGSEAVDWEPMVERLVASEPVVLAAIEGLDDAALDADGFDDPFGNVVTRGELLGLLAFHQIYHAGQLGLSRRVAGLPGVIRGPSPEPAEA